MRKIAALVALITVWSCSVEKDSDTNRMNGELGEVKMPSGFDFSTFRNVGLNFQDNEDAVYRIFAHYQDERDLISSGRAQEGSFDRVLELGGHYDRLEVVRYDSRGKTRRYFDLSSGDEQLNLNFQKTGKTAGLEPEDVLYAINNQGDFFTIDMRDGNFTEDHSIVPPIRGSIANAVDTVNEWVYYYGNRDMHRYDILTNTHTKIADFPGGFPLGGSFPRLEFDHVSGNLFGSNGTSLYEFNPNTGAVVHSYTLSGFVNNSSGGDLAFTPDGKRYLAAFSGLYEITNLDGGSGTATMIRISAENLPFQLTSPGYDRDGFLYAGTNDNPSKLVMIDPLDGSYAVVKTMSVRINDLGSVVSQGTSICKGDSDGDGVCDELDAVPNDPAVAFEEYIPSLLGNGTYAYEDLWPAYGDYDFNDLVIRYRYRKQLNASNEVVRIICRYVVTAVGAGYRNGFGMELDIDPSEIASITGYVHNQGIVTVDAKGLEVGTAKPSFILFEDAYDVVERTSGGFFNTELSAPHGYGDSLDVVIEFTNPISDATIVPTNPFLFVNGVRSHEVHLADQAPTSLMDQSLFNKWNDDSNPGAGRYFRDENNVPWAINIAHAFRHPLEKVRIDAGYNYFIQWGMSGGVSYPDWYKDNAGYRNVDQLYLRE